MAKRNKYNRAAREDRTTPGGWLYDSKAEMLYAERLRILLAAGEIVAFCEQPRLYLGLCENRYVPDFFVVPKDGDPHYVDVKGMETAVFKKNKRLWAAYGPPFGRHELVIVRHAGSRADGSPSFRIVERIVPGDKTVEVGRDL